MPKEDLMTTHSITVTVNDAVESLAVPSHMTLLQMLRERLALTGTKNGCAAGECGACTVLLNGEPVNACMVLAVEADGAEVVTVEGLARLPSLAGKVTGGQGDQETRGQGDQETGRQGDRETLHPLQRAFVDEGAVQCGFCTPGMLMSAYALLQRNPSPGEDEIRAALVGNLCRCTGYTRIVRAIQKTALAVEHAPRNTRQEAGSKRQEAGSKRQEAGSKRQEAGSKRQEAGSKRQEAGGGKEGAR
jgi:carbon-monoxide dehydrogenase small subunit